MSIDDTIKAAFARYGVKLASGDTWTVQKARVIYHRKVEELGAAAGIAWSPPTVLRHERDEAVILMTARLGEREDWDIGEALVTDGNRPGNYKVSGKQAAYPYAMAMKRGRDRLILKLVGLHELYSSTEADDFDRAPAEREPDIRARPESRGEDPPHDPETGEVIASDNLSAICKEIAALRSINAVTDFMLKPETQKRLGGMSAEDRDNARDYAKSRLAQLGWPGRKAG